VGRISTEAATMTSAGLWTRRSLSRCSLITPLEVKLEVTLHLNIYALRTPSPPQDRPSLRART
jgi:hypothetical protein